MYNIHENAGVNSCVTEQNLFLLLIYFNFVLQRSQYPSDQQINLDTPRMEGLIKQVLYSMICKCFYAYNISCITTS